MTSVEDMRVSQIILNIFLQITYARSQEHLMTLTEDLCENFEDYVQVRINAYCDLAMQDGSINNCRRKCYWEMPKSYHSLDRHSQ